MEDAVSGRVLPWVPPAAQVQAAGRYVAEGPGLARSGDFSGVRDVIEVRELSSGRVRYRVSVGRIAGALTVGRSRDRDVVEQLTLRPDGSLGVWGTLARAGRARAVYVDPRGRVRYASRPVDRAKVVATLPTSRRTVVRLDARRCRGVWVTDATGKRGHRLDREAAGRLRPPPTLPELFNGRTATWDGGSLTEPDNRAVRSRDVLVRTRLDRERLSSRHAPRCP
ncbi:hypothetical protein AB0L40_06085 [Patulibacter sp. NPDC049589]|uniref:hypothetical protein n=1 Tax=Patulibacter sp. NPDC049589 TaxID=3154731 RepID=UPI003428C206